MLESLHTPQALASYALGALLLIGIKRIGNKDIRGFYIALLAELGWVAEGLWTGTPGLSILSVAIMLMYVRNIREWKKQQVIAATETIAATGGDEKAAQAVV
jgi:hypothetical protein